MHGGGRDRSGPSSTRFWNTTSEGRQRQARDEPWSCGNQPAYHSMINRRSVPALHRACLHQRNQPEGKKSAGCEFTFKPLKTDMTAVQIAAAGAALPFLMIRSPTFSPAAP